LEGLRCTNSTPLSRARSEGAPDGDSVLLAATPKACRGLQESDLDATNEKFEEF
jgi:hypothetical protein